MGFGVKGQEKAEQGFNKDSLKGSFTGYGKGSMIWGVDTKNRVLVGTLWYKLIRHPCSSLGPALSKRPTCSGNTVGSVTAACRCACWLRQSTSRDCTLMIHQDSGILSGGDTISEFDLRGATRLSRGIM